MQQKFKLINKTLKKITLLGKMLRFPAFVQAVFLLSWKLCFLKNRESEREKRKGERETFIACSLLFADYFSKMLSRISIACD